MYTCCNCYKKFDSLVYLPMYGYLCKECYKDIIVDYLK